MTSFPCIEHSSLLMSYKHSIVRKYTQIINDHIIYCNEFRYFCNFAVLQVMLPLKLEPIQQN